MALRPRVIAFDVIETLFPLEPLRQRIIDAGQPGHVLELWFTRLLRDAFTLAASGGYRPFAELAACAMAAATKFALPNDVVRGVVSGIAQLDPHPDVQPAMRMAAEAGFEIVTLTNGSGQTTTELLRRAGLDHFVHRVLSVDDVHRFKPAPEIYHYAARSCHVSPDRVALVAAHGWDIHGARQAGLTTGWVSRLEGRFPDVFDPPDVKANGLVGVIDTLVTLPDQ